MIPGEELIFCALGGSGEIGMNVNLYGCRGQWIMVDLGLTFADPAYPGIDLILPDLEFIESQQEDLAGAAERDEQQFFPGDHFWPRTAMSYSRLNP